MGYFSSDRDLSVLVGKRIAAVAVSPDQGTMYFDVGKQSVFAASVEGDCCSESWFSDIYNFDALLGTVSAVENIGLPDYNVDDGRTRQEFDSAYGIKITTDKGSATIAFRNSSNGYYGGWLDDVVECFAFPPDAQPITGDWPA